MTFPVEDENRFFERALGAVAGGLDRLIKIAGQELSNVRRYVKELETGSDECEDDFLATVQCYAETFTEATSITVSVQADLKLHLSSRLAREVFQAIEEGLSNVRKHTQAT